MPYVQLCEALSSRTDLGSAEPEAILVFGAPHRCDLFGPLSEKHESMPLLWVVHLQKYVFCGSDFGSTIALDQLCPSQMAYWAKTYATILTRAAHSRHVN